MQTVLSKLRLKRGYLLASLLILALALSACANPEGAGQAVDGTSAPDIVSEPTDTLGLGEPGVDATLEPAATMPAAEPAGETPDTMGDAMGDTVMVSSHDEFGEILTDGEGMTLYLFTNDTPNTSNCYDQCATNWPPLLTTGEPVAGSGVDADLLGVTERTDGTSQVTYNGWPLYYWASDANPGDATGQGVGDVWYVVSPEGEMIEGAAE
jgi:predicted lipoprotein with Yx(FWY)xxD motif